MVLLHSTKETLLTCIPFSELTRWLRQANRFTAAFAIAHSQLYAQPVVWLLEIMPAALIIVLHLQEAQAVQEEELPLTLPPTQDFKPSGRPESPLAKITDWVQTTDPSTGVLTPSCYPTPQPPLHTCNSSD